MPTTVNGIGTTYLGKKNLQTYPGVCSSCGAEIMLEDYETGLYFCFIFIPLIPLGRKQIIGHCQSCTRHQAMPVHQWQQIKAEAIDSGMAALAADQQNPQVALELVGTLDGFHEQEQAFELAAATKSQHDENADVQLELGAWYEQKGHLQDANACFDRAFELDPEHPGAVRARGLTILEEGRLEEAHAMLEKLFPPSPAYDPSVPYALALAYQQRQQHPDAMKLFELIQASSPEWTKDRAFKKAVKKSKKALP